ncbi:MAG: PD-(D/E)XK nuclease family protein [Schumannella sp.]
MTDPTTPSAAQDPVSGAALGRALGPALDAGQRRVLALPVGACATVVGAPGSGKTHALVKLAAHRVESDGFAPDELVALAAGRHAAAALRDRMGVRIGRVSTGPLARTAASIAFEAVTARAVAEGAPAPALLSGGDHDLVIRELLDGHLESGTGPRWPDPLDAEVRRLRTFRTELRELLMRATEHGIDADGMRRLAAQESRPAWAAAADFADEYREIIASARTERLDPAELTAFAEAAVRDGLAGERLGRLRLILVDDVQQLGEGTLRMLAAFARRGVAIVGFGDPDLAGDVFRGGDAGTVAAFSARMGSPDAERIVLEGVHRHGPALRAAVAGVTGRIGAAGLGVQRRAESTREDAPDPIRAILAPSTAALHRAIARQLRERHLLEGVPWSRLAVVVRSGAAIPGIARALAAAPVPTRTLLGGRTLRDEAAAGALLELVSAGVGREPLDASLATRLLRGPFGRLDAVGLRRLRRALRAAEFDAGGTRGADELLVEALTAPGALAMLDHAVGRDARRTAEVLAAVRAAHDAGATAEEVLWAAWEGSRVADDWKRLALGGGIAADEAGRALDGVVALFTAARRFVERRPDEATAEVFLAEVLDAEVPDDTLAPQPEGESVLVATPSGTIGFEFDTVVVAGLQEGRWPDLRVRGSLLGAPEFVAAATGRPTEGVDARREVLSDELRMLALAASRAAERLIVAAVRSDDEAPSPFFGLLAGEVEPVSDDDPPLTVRGLTGRLRRILTAESGRGDAVIAARGERTVTEEDRAAAASGLAALAAAEVPGADPESWHGLRGPSTERPIFDLEVEGRRVPVSPSRIETVERSPMEWFVSVMAGGGSGLSANVGTLVHDVMEHARSADVEVLWEAMLERFDELEFESDWHAEAQRRIARTHIEALAGYLRDFARDGGELVGAEDDFELDIAPARLTGKIDRVEVRDGKIVIVDLKTGTVATGPEAATHPQLGAYQVAYAGGAIKGLPEGHRPGGAALLFTKKGSGRGAARVPYTVRTQDAFDEEALEGFRQRVRDVADDMIGPVLGAAVIDDPFAFGGDIRRVHLPGEVSGD